MTTSNDTPDVRFFRMLGFAKRAGKLSIGTNLALESVRRKRALLVILSSGASNGTKKQVTSKCDFYKIPLITVHASPDMLAHTVGHSAPVATCAVLDARFAVELQKSSGKEVSESSEHGM